MFSSYDDAVKYAAGNRRDPDERHLFASSYVGQIITVYEDGVVSVYKIEEDRSLTKIDNADVLAQIADIQDEIAAIWEEIHHRPVPPTGSITSYTCSNSCLGSYQKWAVGNDIREILLANGDIVAEVGTNIYPLVAPENVDGNFIVYARDKYNKEEVKMGIYEDAARVALSVVSDNYDEAIYIASLLDDALSGKHKKPDGTVLRIKLVDSTETFEDLKYIETLLFEIK